MDRSEIEAINRLVEQHRRATRPKSPARPAGVMLIAGFQFLKAAVLLLTGALLHVNPATISGPDSPLSSLLYVATRGRFNSMNAALGGADALAGVLFFLALYLGAIGIGLLGLHAWSRRTLLLNCGLTIAFGAKAALWPDPAANASPDMTNFHVLLALDAVIFIYLLRGNARELFSTRE